MMNGQERKFPGASSRFKLLLTVLVVLSILLLLYGSLAYGSLFTRIEQHATHLLFLLVSVLSFLGLVASSVLKNRFANFDELLEDRTSQVVIVILFCSSLLFILYPRIAQTEVRVRLVVFDATGGGRENIPGTVSVRLESDSAVTLQTGSEAAGIYVPKYSKLRTDRFNGPEKFEASIPGEFVVGTEDTVLAQPVFRARHRVLVEASPVYHALWIADGKAVVIHGVKRGDTPTLLSGEYVLCGSRQGTPVSDSVRFSVPENTVVELRPSPGPAPVEVERRVVVVRPQSDADVSSLHVRFRDARTGIVTLGAHNSTVRLIAGRTYELSIPEGEQVATAAAVFRAAPREPTVTVGRESKGDLRIEIVFTGRAVP